MIEKRFCNRDNVNEEEKYIPQEILVHILRYSNSDILRNNELGLVSKNWHLASTQCTGASLDNTSWCCLYSQGKRMSLLGNNMCLLAGVTLPSKLIGAHGCGGPMASMIYSMIKGHIPDCGLYKVCSSYDLGSLIEKYTHNTSIEYSDNSLSEGEGDYDLLGYGDTTTFDESSSEEEYY